MKFRKRRLNGNRINIHSVVPARRRLTLLSEYPNLVRRIEERVKFKLSLLERLAMLGDMEDGDIAIALGITKHKFTSWKKRHPAVAVTLRKGRVIPSGNVVRSLYRKAIGFSVPEEKLFYSAKHDKVCRAMTRRYYPPDTVAEIFWLKNHFPDFWRDRKEIENIGPVGVIQSVKFVLVQPGVSGKSEQVIDADFKILPGAGQEGREKTKSSTSLAVLGDGNDKEG